MAIPSFQTFSRTLSNSIKNTFRGIDPLALGLGVAGGAASGFLTGRAQERLFEDISGRLEATLGPQGFARTFNELERLDRPAARAEAAALGLAGRRRETAIRSQVGRLGFSGTTLGLGAGAGAGFQVSQARANRRMNLMREAQNLTQLRTQALLGLLSSPAGTVDPTALSLAGVGTGLEAATISSFANQFRGGQRLLLGG